MSDSINKIKNCPSSNYFFNQLPNKYSVNKFSCIHINIRSMIKNFPKLQQLIHNSISPIDVIIVTEAGITDPIVNLYNLTGYNMYPQLRTNKRGGGIIVYAKNYLKLTLTQHQTKTFENLTCTIKVNACQDVVVCAVYRPPKTNKYIFVKELSKCISTYNAKKNFILIGDMNIDLKHTSPLTDSYLETLSEYGLVCGVSDYTRIEKKLNLITKSCIDHIFARLPTLSPYVAVLDTVLADHRAIMLAYATDTVSADTRVSFRRNIDSDILSKELKNVNWLQTKEMKSPLIVYNFIKQNLQNAKKLSTSTSQHNFKKNCKIKLPWIDDNVNQLCEKRDKLFSLWRQNPMDLKLRLDYNMIRNRVNKVLENKRNKYYIKNIQDNFKDRRKVYQILNEILGKVTSSVDAAVMKAFKGQSTKDIANNFAKGFDEAVKNIIPKCNVQLLDSKIFHRPTDSSIFFHKATSDKVSKLIKTLNPRKAPGSDNIRISDIKCMGTDGAIAIANLINTSIKTGIYPDELKLGCVRPIHKKGKRDDYLNYRPITLLSSIDKIVEKYVCEQIHEFYRKHDVIYKNQFGFQAGKSTDDLLMQFTDDVNEYLDSKKHVLVLFIDFSRAFDTLDHKQLISRLDNCGIRGPLLEWCVDYLKNRKFSVKINESYSDTVTVSQGTAQGSVLGPLHFLSYVNDMRYFINYSSCYQFADDTCLLVAHKDPDVACNLLQSDFDAIAKWCHDAGLVLNCDKTKIIHIKSPYIKKNMSKSIVAHNHKCLHSPSNTTCSCPFIDFVDSFKYLGLHIDVKFNWFNHIEYVCSKLRHFLANIIIIKNRIPYKTKLMLYNALAESYIQYGLGSYGRTFKTYLNKICSLQKRILKNIVPNKIRHLYDDNVKGLFQYCNILPVQTQVNYLLLKKHYFNEKLNKVINHPVCTRAVINRWLQTDRAKNKYGERTVRYIVPRLINRLPTILRDILNKKNLKQKLKRHFIDALDTE
jgi:hypothetical protein